MKVAAFILCVFALAAFSTAQACPYMESKNLISKMDQFSGGKMTEGQTPVINQPLIVDVKKPEEAAN